MTTTRLTFGLLLLAALAAHAQNPQDYPTKPVRFLVPLAAGGGMDTITRALAQKLLEQTGQNFVVDNRGGGGGNIGAEIVMHSAPDGYTIIMMSATAVINPIMYKPRYDLLRDFIPVSQVTEQPYVLAVNPALPVKSVQELIQYAKANPGKLNYASAGQGSLIHLMTELFNLSAGIKAVHVPYKGIGAAYPDLLAGHVQMVFASIVSVQPHVRTQRMRALAVSGATRAQTQPDLPTVAEAGIKGYAVTQWYGVFAPAKTPDVVIERLNKEVVAAARHPDLTKRYAADGAEAVGSRREQFLAHLKEEIAKWTKVIKETGIRGD
ncbi:MAG: tripartite tricarboxylate transporter substrate binding protein [Burkholderiales bacterium]|nr:tripartite tricarboxylate transporter substrate binding protein [Burkholderiales bacterium]